MRSTLTGTECQGALPCPVCTEPLPVRVAKSKKPYFVCEHCGIQLFVRRREGIENLSRLLQQLAESDERLSRGTLAVTVAVSEMQAALIEIRAVRVELEKLGHSSGDRDLQRARAALRKRLRAAIQKLSGASEIRRA